MPPKNRQWAHSPNMLLDHPPEQTDAFVLYIKSSVVMSRVKTFNLRFRAKNYAGDPMMVPPLGTIGSEQSSTAQYIDPRETLGFKEIDALVESFVPSFPRHLRHPIKDNVLDTHLLLAHLSPNMQVFNESFRMMVTIDTSRFVVQKYFYTIRMLTWLERDVSLELKS